MECRRDFLISRRIRWWHCILHAKTEKKRWEFLYFFFDIGCHRINLRKQCCFIHRINVKFFQNLFLTVADTNDFFAKILNIRTVTVLRFLQAFRYLTQRSRQSFYMMQGQVPKMMRSSIKNTGACFMRSNRSS